MIGIPGEIALTRLSSGRTLCPQDPNTKLILCSSKIDLILFDIYLFQFHGE
ncbi:MAG: hypothetical protein IIB07_06230 [Bacteroidetes bacterium]|nr:hypothetical protein [Bacteroidota bacterium]